MGEKSKILPNLLMSHKTLQSYNLKQQEYSGLKKAWEEQISIEEISQNTKKNLQSEKNEKKKARLTQSVKLGFQETSFSQRRQFLLEESNHLERKSLKVNSNLWEYILHRKQEKSKKIVFLTRNFIIPHLLAIFYSCLVLMIQNQVDSICFLNPICRCKNSLWIKIYTLIKSLISNYPLLTWLTFYCYFIRAGLFRMKIIQIGYVFLSVVVIIFFYLTEDGDSARAPDLQIYISSFVFSFFYHLFVLRKMNWKFKEFVRKSLPGSFILAIMLLQYLTNTRWIPYMRDILNSWFQNQGANLYLLFLSFYSALYLVIFKIALLKFGLLIKAENYPNSNPIILTSLICLCYTITIQISSLFHLSITRWGEWVLLFQYCFFLFQFFSGIEPLALISNLAKKIFKITLRVPKKSPIELEIEKIFTGTMIDFIFIFIPRLIIIFTWKRWITFHIIDFYANCRLEIAEQKVFNLEFLIIIISVTCLIAMGTFVIMHKTRNIFMIGKVEKGSLIKQSYKFFLIHCFFELIFQEFQKALS